MSAVITRPDTVQARGQTIVLPGQTPEGGYILSVLLKRTYDIVAGRPCTRSEKDRALIPADVPWGDPMNSTVRYESDFAPFKLGTDAVFNGRAYAPNGTRAQTCLVSVQVGATRKQVLVSGDRVARFNRGGAPVFSDPVPFTTMELRYERAYGGIDVCSNKSASFPYPRNPLGRGFVVNNSDTSVDNLPLPNLEDPAEPLTPERLCIGEYVRWERQPLPAGLGWVGKTWLPRAKLAGIMPADRATEQQLRRAYAELIPAADQRAAYLKHGLPDMDFRFFNGASPGLALPYLNGTETIATHNLGPEGVVSFRLPGDSPHIGLDIGSGVQESQTVIHTVMVHMEERKVDIVWRAAVPYEGPDWLPNMRKMETIVA